MKESGMQKPLFSYSNIALLVMNAAVCLVFLYAVIETLLIGPVILQRVAFYLLISFLALNGSYQVWHSPIRRYRFLDDHFEISGWNVKMWVGYRDIEGLEKRKMRFFSDTFVTLSIRGNPARYRFGNRRNKKLKLDLYSWLLQKTQTLNTQNSSMEAKMKDEASRKPT
jgi:hypothetical protein